MQSNCRIMVPRFYTFEGLGQNTLLRKYSYQGMSCIAKPEQLTDERIRVSYQKLGRYNEYNPNNVYQNNED